jgi:hypothetical protein
MSMRAFDRLPAEFRQFVAYYPRTTSGVALEGVLASAQGNVRQAIDAVRYLLPVEREFDGPLAAAHRARWAMAYAMRVPNERRR